MLREEPLRPQSVVLFYRAQHVRGVNVVCYHICVPGLHFGPAISPSDMLMGNVVQVGAYRSEAEGQPQKIIGRHRSNSCGDLICYAIRYLTGN